MKEAAAKYQSNSGRWTLVSKDRISVHNIIFFVCSSAYLLFAFPSTQIDALIPRRPIGFSHDFALERSKGVVGEGSWIANNGQ